MSNNGIRKDAYAFCAGMLGFGEDEKIYDLLPYFGGTVGSFTKALAKEGYEAHALSFSGLGSAWDRACEVYASITGTQVDYGVAHSKKYGHERFGKVYNEAKFPNWGKPADDGGIQRLHILGHSFGGATVRMFAHLLAFGSEEERAATPAGELSPLFEGGHGDLLKTVTTIAGPHEGTVVIDAIGIQRPMLAALTFYGFGAILGNTPFRKLYDMQLMQWKLTSDRDGKANPFNMLRIGRMRKLWSACDDVYYDLTLKGAKELNEFLETNPDVYYFSIPTDSSKRKKNGMYKQERYNVGKSTLMNALVGEKLSIVTSKAQTTRHRIMGIVNGEDYQIVFSDTPGILKPNYMLQESMMDFVHTAITDADIILYVTDVIEKIDKNKEYIDKLNNVECPVLIAINKLDESSQAKVIELVEKWHSLVPKAEILPISALNKFNVDTLLKRIVELLPQQHAWYDRDVFTDKSMRFFASEIIREKILQNYNKEIPYCTEVVIESFEESEEIYNISAIINVVRESQKGIIIGPKGLALKRVGTQARRDMEKFFEKKVFLKMFVKVNPNWREDKKELKKFGYIF